MMRMKTWMLAAGLLAVPGLAMAAGQDTGQQDPGMQDPGMHQPRDPTATSPSTSGMNNAQAFEDSDNFEVEGTIASVDAASGNITLQREDLPPAELRIASDTKIEVDGETGSIQDLQPGSEVRDEFNLSESQAIAVSVDAKESKEQKRQRTSPTPGQRAPGSEPTY